VHKNRNHEIIERSYHNECASVLLFLGAVIWLGVTVILAEIGGID
jgi:hypothetical protein